MVLQFDSIECALVDQRRFGRIWWNGVLPKGWDILGSIEEKKTPAAFRQIIETSKGGIKNLLMDQKKIAGLGNIYANEILYKAGVHPKRTASRLVNGKVDALWSAAREILALSLVRGGISVKNFYHPDGQRGKFQERFSIYGRRKQSCRKCSGPIKVTVIAQRSTFYCPQCQK